MNDASPLKALFLLLAGLRGWRPRNLAQDFLAGITLAAITIPEQMATARLGGFEPQTGFYAFVGGTLGFALLGRHRQMSVGADSTITPIFAVTLAGLAAGQATGLTGNAIVLAALVGLFLIGAALLRLGVVASLLSVPVVTGFLGGIAVHITASQLPNALGLTLPSAEVPARLLDIVLAISGANLVAALIGMGVLATMVICEKVNPRIPGALLAIATATILVTLVGADRLGIATLGTVSALPADWALPPLAHLATLIPLALLLTLVIIMQVSAVDRAFPSQNGPDVNKDFLGVGAGNLLSGLFGAFPVNASPPRTAVGIEAGATSQMSAVLAAALVLALAFIGGEVLGAIPVAALAGVLLFVALRLFRLAEFLDITRRAPSEALLAVLTFLAIVFLPIQSGIAIGVGLALLHGVWMIAHSPVLTLSRLPGTTIWWPDADGETEPDVAVLAFQAPLLFANADSFKRQVLDRINEMPAPGLVVLEASAIAEIDYSAAQSLRELIEVCKEKGLRVMVARLDSLRAIRAVDRLGIRDLLGPEGMSHSVQEAINTYRKGGKS